MKRIGLFGGSFNPIHNGHIALAQAVLRQCRIDEVWLMVSPQNPLKPSAALLDDKLRYDMACRAVQDVASISVSDYEFHLPRPSYTWNTLCHLREDFPDRVFSLIIGGDNWAAFTRWRQWQNILSHHDVIVYPRGEHRGTIEVPLLDVSSTLVRQKVQKGESIDGLVPESIAGLVEKLYAR